MQSVEEIESRGIDAWSKVFALGEQIRARLALKKVEISHLQCRKHELHNVTLEEWRVVALSYFLSCCSNSGSVRYESEAGLILLSHLRAVGLDGCANVLERSVALDDEFAAYREQVDKGKISLDQFNALIEEWQSRVDRLEATAEGDENAFEVLWAYVLRNREGFG